MDEQQQVVTGQGGPASPDGSGNLYTVKAEEIFAPLPETTESIAADWLRQARRRFSTLKQQRYSTFTDQEWDHFLSVCYERGLNPIANQIYADLRPGHGGDTEVNVIIGINGLRLLAIRSGSHGGAETPIYDYTDTSVPVRATKRIFRLINGERVPFEGEALWHNYYPGPGTLWDRMPEVCLGNCAEAAAIRQAFPEETGGLYTPEELMKGKREPRRAPAPAAPTDGEPGSPVALEMALMDEFGITDERARKDIIRTFRKACVADDDAPAFYAAVYRAVKAAPEAYGGKRVEQTV